MLKMFNVFWVKISEVLDKNNEYIIQNNNNSNHSYYIGSNLIMAFKFMKAELMMKEQLKNL